MHRAAVGLMIVMVGACGSGSSTADGPTPAATATSPSTPATSSTGAEPTTTALVTTTTVAEDDWSVVVVGDFGDGGAAELEVAAAMQAWVVARPESHALVTTGDNFYTSDVAAAWEVPYGWVGEVGLPVWPVPGNHDIESPGQWQASVTVFGGFPRWRRETLGAVTFVLLDSNQVRSADQRAWLEDAVATLGTKPWVAVFHDPWWSCSTHGSRSAVDEMWGDLLQGAVLVLNGHDHNYQRFASESGWSVVTGGGGRRLHPIAACPTGTAPPVAAVSAHHFVAITEAGGGLLVEVIGVDGAHIDTFWVEFPTR
jgi:hypothetical protein